MSDVQWWTLAPVAATRLGEAATRYEEEGWAGMLCCDSQNVLGDVYSGLALAAAETRRLGLGTGVTNPITRHPAATAAAAVTIQEISHGRMVLGIGRGDSSAAFIGLAPLDVRRFERYLVQLRQLLHGEGADMAESAAFSIGESFQTLGLHTAHEASTLRWVDPELPTVPIDVAASGPAVIRAAARHADRITFSVGASVDRLSWALKTGRAAAEEAGRDPDSLSWGAYVNVVCHEDPERAIALGIGTVASFARMSVMKGRPAGEMPDRDRQMLIELHRSYDMTTHGESGSGQGTLLSNGDFAHRFGILGTPDYCVRRLREIVGTGLDRVVVQGAATGVAEEEVHQLRRHFVTDVLPNLPRGHR